MTLVTLKRRAEFLRVRGGPRWVTPAFVLEARQRPVSPSDTDGPRFGFTITKQVGKAVVRNRIRRRLRSLVRSLEAGHAQPNFDYVLIGRTAASGRPFAELKADLEQAFHGVHRLKKPGRAHTKT